MEKNKYLLIFGFLATGLIGLSLGMLLTNLLNKPQTVKTEEMAVQISLEDRLSTQQVYEKYNNLSASAQSTVGSSALTRSHFEFR